MEPENAADYPESSERLVRTRFEIVRDHVSQIRKKDAAVLAILGVFMVTDVTMIIVAFYYKNDCPIQTSVPIWLVVNGVSSIFSLILLFDKKDDNPILRGLAVFDYFFHVAWFLVGNYYIFNIYRRVSYEPIDREVYCHPVLYLFTFWLLIITWTFFTCLFLVSTFYFLICCRIKTSKATEV